MNQPHSFWGKFSGARGIAIAMPRTAKQFLLISVDFLSLFFAVWAAYGLRMGEFPVPPLWQLLLFAAAPAFAIPVFMANGLYRSVIRYVGEKALWTIVKCMFLATLLWASLVFFLDVQRFEAAPRSVPILDFMLGTLLVAASRFGARWLIWLPVRRINSARQVLIFGANETGIQLANSLGQGKDMFPAGFVDDNPSLIHKDVSGFRVGNHSGRKQRSRKPAHRLRPIGRSATHRSTVGTMYFRAGTRGHCAGNGGYTLPRQSHL